MNSTYTGDARGLTNMSLFSINFTNNNLRAPIVVQILSNSFKWTNNTGWPIFGWVSGAATNVAVNGTVIQTNPAAAAMCTPAPLQTNEYVTIMTNGAAGGISQWIYKPL